MWGSTASAYVKRAKRGPRRRVKGGDHRGVEGLGVLQSPLALPLSLRMSWADLRPAPASIPRAAPRSCEHPGSGDRGATAPGARLRGGLDGGRTGGQADRRPGARGPSAPGAQHALGPGLSVLAKKAAPGGGSARLPRGLFLFGRAPVGLVHVELPCSRVCVREHTRLFLREYPANCFQRRPFVLTALQRQAGHGTGGASQTLTPLGRKRPPSTRLGSLV